VVYFADMTELELYKQYYLVCEAGKCRRAIAVASERDFLTERSLHSLPRSKLDFIHFKLESFSAVAELQTGSQKFSDVLRLCRYHEKSGENLIVHNRCPFKSSRNG